MLKKLVVLLSILAFAKVAFAAGADSTSKKPEHEVVVKGKEHEHHEKNGKHKKHKNKHEKHEKHEEKKHEKHEEHEHSKEAK